LHPSPRRGRTGNGVAGRRALPFLGDAVKRLMQAVDAWQCRTPVAGPAVAVLRKFRDDDGNALAVALAWYGFVAISPLLLLVVTIFGFLGGAALGGQGVYALEE